MECVFCKISNKQIPAEIVLEDKDVVAFNDIFPKAPVHILIVPKKHIASLKEIKPEDQELVGKIIFAAKRLAEEKKLSGYKLIMNVGHEAGQTVEHLHLHLLSGNITSLP